MIAIVIVFTISMEISIVIVIVIAMLIGMINLRILNEFTPSIKIALREISNVTCNEIMSIIKNCDLFTNVVEWNVQHKDFGRKRSSHKESIGNVKNEEELEKSRFLSASEEDDQ